MAMDTQIRWCQVLTHSPSSFRRKPIQPGFAASEHAVHFCLALGPQATWTPAPGDIVFERPAGRNGTRIDLWIREPYDIAIEVKYLRSHPRGSQPARPMHCSPFCCCDGSEPTDVSAVFTVGGSL
jgi:hypothetical protein